MPREEGFNFSFVSKALPEDTFTVAELKGTEGLSMLYEFEIMLYADDPEIDLKAVLQNPATLTIIPEGEEERKFHGIPAVFEQLHEYDEYIYYRLKLAPRLWLADQYHENMLFLDKKVPEILEEILKQVGLTSQDYELKLTGSYQPWEYICQYNETDFDFISRWMEREGIYYYFDQSGDAEKLIITDSSTAHQPIEGGAVSYSPPGQATGSIFEQVQAFTCRQQILPQKVVLKDYNYRKPSLDLKGEADVDSEGRGSVYIYGEHFKTPEEGNALAKIRAEELLCREALFYGESTVSPFLPGYLFELEEHYRDSYNKKYLLTEVTHQGVQAEFLAMAAGTSRITELKGPAYENRFTCISDTPQFRPERKTVKPRIDGTLNAKVDAAGDGQYAEIDDEGRYKVKLPFDQSDAGDSKASRWIRMAQPYAGADYGMHFPLHKGIEVLLTFIDGDPDRPIIAGSVPNPETMSPITSGAQTKTMIRTGGGNQIHTEDQDGGQLLKLYSPTAKSSLRLGSPNPGGNTGVMIFTEGDEHVIIQGHRELSVDQNDKTTVTGEREHNVSRTEIISIGEAQSVNLHGGRLTNITDGGDQYNVQPYRHATVNGEEKHTVTGLREKRIEGKEKNFLDGGQDIYVQNKRIMQVSSGGEDYKVYGNRLHEIHGNETYKVTGDRHIDVGGNHTGHSSGLTRGISQGSCQTIRFGADATLNYSLAAEGYMGAKIISNHSIVLEMSSGLKFGKEGLSIKETGPALNKAGASIRKAALHFFG